MTIEITRLSHDGRGVGRDNAGKTVFVDGVLPGEYVNYQVTRSKKKFDEAIVVEVVQPAPTRVEPQCAHFLICGGCSQQHISAQAQLEAKQHTVLELLQHFGQVQPENILPPLEGPLWGYRNKGRLGVRYVIKKDRVFVGFREKHSNYLAAIDNCEILHPKIGHLLQSLQGLIATLNAYREIAQIEVAVGDDRMALIFRNMIELEANDQQLLINFAKEHDFDLYLQPGKVESIYKLWPENTPNRLYYTLPQYNLEFAFFPLDFTQINPTLNRKMVAQAIDLLQLNENDEVLDLFCGLGNFTLPMATIARSVVGVEGSSEMVERGYENAKRNNISNVEFFAADLFTDQTQAAWADKRYTKVLLDPPRSGAEAILPLIANMGVEAIVYVSCNPATFARDSGLLTQQFGYKMVQMGIMNMFPHTLHVETIALFTK